MLRPYEFVETFPLAEKGAIRESPLQHSSGGCFSAVGWPHLMALSYI